MPIIAKESVEIPTDRFSGPIEKVEIRSSQNDEGKIVQYVECTVNTGRKDIKGWNGLMKFSVPAYLSYTSSGAPNSGLARLISRLGLPSAHGKTFDEASFKGLVVGFDTKRDGNFTNVVVESVYVVEEA